MLLSNFIDENNIFYIIGIGRYGKCDVFCNFLCGRC